MSEKPIFGNPMAHVDIAQETQFAPNGIVSRTLFRSPDLRIILFGFSEGQELSEHSTRQHAIVQMLTGEADWTLGQEQRTLHAGEVLYMPPGLSHAVRAREPFSMMITLSRVRIEEGKPDEAAKCDCDCESH